MFWPFRKPQTNKRAVDVFEKYCSRIDYETLTEINILPFPFRVYLSTLFYFCLRDGCEKFKIIFKGDNTLVFLTTEGQEFLYSIQSPLLYDLTLQSFEKFFEADCTCVDRDYQVYASFVKRTFCLFDYQASENTIRFRIRFLKDAEQTKSN